MSYAQLNGLNMHYEIHGSPSREGPLVLLHGGISNIETDFGLLLPGLTKDRESLGDLVRLPRSRLAILPGTTHITLVHRAEWLLSMIADFLDAPMPEEG